RVRTVRVALAGCGVVGSSLVRLVRERAAEIEATRGLRLEIARILVRNPERSRPVQLERALLTTDPAALLAADADVLVEAIGGLDPAEQLARATLERGRALVTANKELLAAAGAELAALAQRTGAAFDFEAAVAGGVPVVRALRGSLGESGIVSVRGVLNGTTNYLLDRLSQGAAYAEALAEAQAKGFAEPDPSRDVDGRDAAAKIAVLAWLAFGVDPARLVVRRQGLLPDADLLGSAAALFGGVPKLLAEAVRRDAGVVAAVEPAVLDAASELAAVRGEHNYVHIASRWNGSIRLAGPGAGGAPTASALLSDMLHTAGPLRALPEQHAPPALDDRALPWILAVRAEARDGRPAGAVESALARSHVSPRERREARDIVAVSTEPAEWHRVAAAVEALQRQGARAVLLRDSRLEG
ncbi:MAG TPA: homoserine dehydrogenase, partial [Longimicrobiales bacterium]